MSAALQYGIQLDRAVDSLHIGERHRADLGDLTVLAQSMREHGLLQPPTITPEGVVLIGARRVAAARLLGWKVITVWVRSGLSDRLGRLLSEHADHALHKPLTALEAAGLYRELKAVFEEASTMRQAATRFGAAPGGADGTGDSPAPKPTFTGRAREQAARLISGRDSSQQMERICRIEDLADDETASEIVRNQAQAEIDRIRDGAGVHASHLRMRAALSLDQLDQIAADPTKPAEVREEASTEAARLRTSDAKAAEMERLAQDALARVKGPRRSKPKLVPSPRPQAVPALYSSRSFLATWGELDGWWESYDPEQMVRDLTEEQIELFFRVTEGTAQFAEQMRAARTALAA